MPMMLTAPVISCPAPGISNRSRLAGPGRPLRTLASAAALWSAVAAAALVASLTPSTAQAAPAQGVNLRLIAFNDFHGNLESPGLALVLPEPAAPGKTLRVPVGGMAALAGMVQRLRDSADNSLLLSSGDLVGAAPLVSTLFRHESTIDLMNRIGLELNVAGNHEFDGGTAELKRLYQGGCARPGSQTAITSCALDKAYGGARFPLLAANVRDARGQAPYAPWVIKRYQGIPVGVIGAVTRSTPSLVVPSGVAGLRFEDEVAAINRAAAELRRRGVKAIIASVHEGGEVGAAGQRADWNDSACRGADGPIFDINRRLSPDVDVVFSAHTHQGYRCEIQGRVVIQATSYGRGLSVIDLVLDPRTRDIDRRQTRSINLPVLNELTDAGVRDRLATATREPYGALLRVSHPDAEIAARVAQYAAVVAPKAGQPVGRITGRFSRASAPGGQSDSAAGRMVADAQLAASLGSGAQVAFMNPGGVRTDLECAAPPCTVSFGAAFSMQPFGNSLVVMSLTGEQIRRMLEQQFAPGATPGFLSPSAGFSYRWLAAAPAGQRAQDLRLNGQPLLPTQTLPRECQQLPRRGR